MASSLAQSELATASASASAADPARRDLSVFPDRLRGKRILLCTESFGPVNGVSRTTLMLVNHLRAHGANVAVVAPHNQATAHSFVPADAHTTPPTTTSAAGPATPADNPEVRIHGYPLPFNPELSVVYPVRLSTLYARSFGEAAPDLIYLASPASLGFQVLLQLRQQPEAAQVPVLANFQTDLAGYCAILLPAPLGRLAVYAFSQVEGFLFRHPSVQTIFYPSRGVRRYLADNGVAPEKMQLLRRGVNTQLFHPDRRCPALRHKLLAASRQAGPGDSDDPDDPGDPGVVLVCVARMGGEKGFDFLAAVAAALDQRGLHFTLYVVGGNRSAAVEAEVKALFSSNLQKRGRVVFAGFLVGEALAQAYASADVFCHCSVTETFGLVVLESMASGVPVVARDEGGPSDIVDHGVSGFLVAPADLDAFVARVLLLARDARLRRRLGANARRQACNATWDKINNTVAWRMLDAMDQRKAKEAAAETRPEASTASDADQAADTEESCSECDSRISRCDSVSSVSSVDSRTRQSTSVAKASRSSSTTSTLSLSFWKESLDTKVAVDARLAAGQGVIMGFWGVVGMYLIFIKAALWFKSLARVAASGDAGEAG